MNAFLAFCARQSRALLALLVLLTVVGFAIGLRLPASILPEIAFPRITVIADSGERPAEEMVRTVTRPLEEALARLTRPHTADAALELLRKAGVPAGRVRTVPEVLSAPQTLAREMVIGLPHPTIPDFKTVGIPVKLSATPGRPRTAPPSLGEHTDRVLGELGYDEAARARLRTEGAT
jgi:crotonobetainyl-CoA:carnitine CoA-transferase CaiB-like acyl-CoA transferase